MKNKNIPFLSKDKADNDFYDQMKIIIVEDLNKINESLNKSKFEFKVLHDNGMFLWGSTNRFSTKETLLQLNSDSIFEVSFGVIINKKTNTALLDTTNMLINLKSHRSMIFTVDLERKEFIYNKPSAESNYYHNYTKNKKLKANTCEKVTQIVINNNYEIFNDNYIFSSDFKNNLSIFNMFLVKNGILNKDIIKELSESKSSLDFKNITESLEILCLEHDLRHKTTTKNQIKHK